MTRRIRRNEADAARRGVTLIALFLVFLTLAIPGFSFAQTTEKEEDGPGSAKLRPEERPTFWLVDENGAWRAPLPNWTLEEVMRIVDSRREAQSVTPWAIQNVDASGTVVDGIARLRVELEMSVANGVVRAPLGLSEGVYIPSPEDEASGDASRGGFSYEGPGLCVLDVDRKTGEYVAIFQSPFPGKTSESAESAPSEDPKSDENAPADEATENASDSESAEPTPQVAETSEPTTQKATEKESAGKVYESERLRPNDYRLVLDLCFTVETPGATDGSYLASKKLSDDVEYRLAATFPPSLHSQLTLEIPMADVELVTVKGASADSPTTMSEDSSELKLRGLGRGGERVEIGWRRDLRRMESAGEEERVVYQVEDASIVAELDARGTTYDATLPIRAFGGESDLFYVELPPDSSLTPESVEAFGINDVQYEVTGVRVVDDAEDAEAADGAGETSARTIEIRLAQKTSVVTLRLKTRSTSPEATASGERRPPRHLAGFSVQGAQKQYGQIRIVKSQDSEFNVSPVYGASGSLDNSLDDGAEIYSFFAQPFLMTAEGYVRETVVDVRPEYLLNVDCDELRLHARFLYSVYGSKIRELRLRLNDWRLAKVYSSDNMFNQEGVVPANDRGETVIPLATPADGEILLELDFVRDTNPDAIFSDPKVSAEDDASCSTSFPIPIAARVEPASVVVLPENAINVIPYDEQIHGMNRKTARSFGFNIEIPSEARQTPLYYQTRLTGEGDSDPLFVADIQRLPQKIWVEVSTEATLSDKGVFHVNETLEYRIEREPLDTFEFQTLAHLLDPKRERGVKCFVDGRAQNLEIDPPETSAPAEQTSDPASGEERPAQPAKNRFATSRVVVDTPRIGTCVVSLQYDLDPVEIRERQTNLVRVDLFQPKTNERFDSVSNDLTLSAPVGLGLSFSKPTTRSVRRTDSAGADEENSDAGFQSFWTAEPRKFSDDGKFESIRCSSLMPEYVARFSASLDSRDAGMAIVDRAWVQSWFSDSARVDRVVWKMTCDREFIEFKLPKDCATERVSVAIDGEKLPVGGDARHGLLFRDHIVRVPIDVQRQRKEIALEIDYISPYKVDSRGGIPVEFPDFAIDSVWIRRVYWQTIFNHSRIVVVDPHEWTPEFVVRRGVGLGALFFRRVPTMTQDALCDWIGLERREPIPQEANVYLYSRFCQTPIAPEALAGAPNEHVEPTLPNARLVVANNALLVFLGSGVVLLLGLGLVYLQVMTARQALVMRGALLVLCALALIFAALRPLLALLFLQTTTIGILLTMATAATTTILNRRESRSKTGDSKNANEKGA